MLQCQRNTVDKTVQSVMAMQTSRRSSHAVVTLRGTVLDRLCIRASSIHTCITVIAACSVCQTCFLEANHSALFGLTLVLILCPSTLTKHTCIRLHVSTSFGSSTPTEQGITLTVLWHKICHFWTYVCAISRKHNQLFVVHWSTYLQSLDSFFSQTVV